MNNYLKFVLLVFLQDDFSSHNNFRGFNFRLHVAASQEHYSYNCGVADYKTPFSLYFYTMFSSSMHHIHIFFWSLFTTSIKLKMLIFSIYRSRLLLFGQEPLRTTTATRTARTSCRRYLVCDNVVVSCAWRPLYASRGRPKLLRLAIEIRAWDWFLMVY